MVNNNNNDKNNYNLLGVDTVGKMGNDRNNCSDQAGRPPVLLYSERRHITMGMTQRSHTTISMT